MPLKNKLMQRRKTLNKQQLKRRPRQPEKQQWLRTTPLKPQEPPLRSIKLLSRLLLMKLPKLLLRKLLQRLKDRSQPPKEQLKTKRQRKHLKNSLPRRLLLPRQLKLQQRSTLAVVEHTARIKVCQHCQSEEATTSHQNVTRTLLITKDAITVLPTVRRVTALLTAWIVAVMVILLIR